ncbi:MAG TPA: integrin alpha [Gaiellaceae bacterium]|nr:integrin alpha [Gaiellaceae bacterium]
MHRVWRALAVTGAAAAALSGMALALPAAQSAWDAPVPLQQANVRVRGAAEDDRLGWSVAGLGDVNGDGKADVVVGAPFAGNNERASSGSAYVLYGPFGGAEIDVGARVIQGFRIDGAGEGDFAGGALAAAGDVNGDRLADVLVGAAETDFNEREQSGSVYVLFGGSHRGEIDLAPLGTLGFRVDGADSTDFAGSSVASAGDVNGDGRADFLLGAPLADNNGRRDSGSAYLVLGKASTARVDLASAAVYLRMDGDEVADATGWSVAGVGDVNGDGRRDVLVGAPYASANGRLFSGSAFVVFGRPSPAVVDLAALGSAGFRIDGAARGDLLFGGTGWSVAGAGDVNGDGRADVVVGFPFFDANRREDSGSAYVVFGKGTPEPVDLAALGTKGFRIDGAAAGDLAGVAVAGLGDVNWDGRADVLVGAEQADNNGLEDSGSVYVVYGRTATDPVDLGALNGAGARIDGEVADDLAGWSVARAGDINGDGTQDVLVGAHASDGEGRLESGAAYVLFAPNRRPPKLAVVAKSPQAVVRQKGITVRASCDETCTLRATGTIVAASQRARLPLRAASGRLADRGQRTLKLGLPPAGLSRLQTLLAGMGRIEATLTVRAIDDDGNGSVATRKILVRRS